MKTLSHITRGLLDILFPSFCLVCERQLANCRLCSFCHPEHLEINLQHICHTCGSAIGLGINNETCWSCANKNLKVSSIRTIWEYSGNVKDIIVKMKYKPSLHLSRLIARLAAPYFDTFYQNQVDWDLIIPVCSSPESKDKRGFNQCSIITRELIKQSSCLKERQAKLLYAGLKHSGGRSPQASLKLKERAKNMKSVFAANPQLVENKSILLIDDVLTTGATSESAASTLLDAGAKEVHLFCLARSASWGRKLK